EREGERRERQEEEAEDRQQEGAERTREIVVTEEPHQKQREPREGESDAANEARHGGGLTSVARAPLPGPLRVGARTLLPAPRRRNRERPDRRTRAFPPGRKSQPGALAARGARTFPRRHRGSAGVPRRLPRARR